jgi:MFS family permease
MRSGSSLAEIGEGLRYVRRQPAILWLVSVTFAMTVLGMSFVNLAPLIVTDVLGGSAASLGWVFTAWGVGGIAGSLVLAGWLDQIRAKGAAVLLMSAVFVIGLIGFAYSTSIAMAALFQFLPGLANTSIMVISNAVILANTPALLRGRVMGIYYMNRGLMPVGALVAAFLGEAVGVQAAIAVRRSPAGWRSSSSRWRSGTRGGGCAPLP